MYFFVYLSCKLKKNQICLFHDLRIFTNSLATFFTIHIKQYLNLKFYAICTKFKSVPFSFLCFNVIESVDIFNKLENLQIYNMFFFKLGLIFINLKKDLSFNVYRYWRYSFFQRSFKFNFESVLCYFMFHLCLKYFYLKD